MKKILLPLSMLIAACLTGVANAEDKQGSGLAWYGYIQTDNRALTHDENGEIEYSWQEYRLDLQAEAKPSDSSRFYGDFWIRSWSLPNVSTSSDLSAREKIFPVGFDLREAYADIYGFLAGSLDIRAGRQRIAWGTGDRINPTDNLNPDDLEDIWDFGRHLGSDCIKATYYIGKAAVTGVFIPIFSPAALPSGGWSSMLMPSTGDMNALLAGLPPYLNVSASDEVLLPGRNLKKSAKTGARVSVSDIFGFNLSASYVYGRDDLPIVQSVKAYLDIADVNILTTLFYPNMNIIGLDMSGSAGEIGVWAEAAMFIPEKATMTTDMTALNPYIPVSETVLLDGKPYYKYVAGLDYTFKTDTYINIQCFHGFVHERGKHNLEDYILIGVEQKMFNGKLKITPVAGAVEIGDFKNIKENYALVYVPEIALYPVDGAEVTVGAHIIDGKKTTTFGKAADLDEAYLKIKYSF